MCAVERSLRSKPRLLRCSLAPWVLETSGSNLQSFQPRVHLVCVLQGLLLRDGTLDDGVAVSCQIVAPVSILGIRAIDLHPLVCDSADCESRCLGRCCGNHVCVLYCDFWSFDKWELYYTRASSLFSTTGIAEWHTIPTRGLDAHILRTPTLSDTGPIPTMSEPCTFVAPERWGFHPRAVLSTNLETQSREVGCSNCAYWQYAAPNCD